MTEENKIASFQDLKVWQESHRLVLLTYKTTKGFPRDEMYGLTSQMRRAAISITSNIAEGFGRRTYQERLRFYIMARGSISELLSQCILAKDLGYLTVEQYTKVVSQLESSHKLLGAFINKTRTFLKNPSSNL